MCLSTANLPTNIVDFRGFDSSITLILRGGILMSIGKTMGKFESSNVSRDNVSREIGCILSSWPCTSEALPRVHGRLFRADS